MPDDHLSSVERTLLVEVHRLIAEAASIGVEDLAEGRIGASYPPEDLLDPDELEALQALALSPALRSGLEKLVASACGHAFSEFFSLLDGAGAPEVQPDGAAWRGADLAPRGTERQRTPLHEAFFDTWWTWRDRR